MKKLLPLVLLLCACAASQAAFNTISVTFTNAPATGDSFTRNGVTVRWTNTPANSSAWITTNSPTRAATNLWNHLGANMPSWYTRMSNATNLLISGNNAQFSITGTYAVLTTNSSSSGTNLYFLMLSGDWINPQKYQPFATNRTNDASELLNLEKTYALADARLRFFSNEHYKAARLVDGSSTNLFITNSPSVQTTNLATDKITATSGQLDGVNVTSAPVVTATSARITDLQVFNGAVITNLSAPGTGAGSFKVGESSEADGIYAQAFGNTAKAHGAYSVAGGPFSEVTPDYSMGWGWEVVVNPGADEGFGWGKTVNINGAHSFGFGNTLIVDYDYSWLFGENITDEEDHQFKFGDSTYSVNIPGQLRSGGTARFANIVRSRFSGPMRTDEGAYSGITGFSNNIVQLSTNPVTRLSGATGNYNVNSLRTADGMEMANRAVEIINDTTYTATLVDTSLDGFETLNTNEMRCGGVNLTLAAGASAKLKYSTSYSRWELFYPSPLAAFNIIGTTNQIAFGASNSPPANTSTVRKWISAQITGETNAYRIALFE